MSQWRNTRTSVEEDGLPFVKSVPWKLVSWFYTVTWQENKKERRSLYISIWISYDRVKSSWKWITNFEANFVTIFI